MNENSINNLTEAAAEVQNVAKNTLEKLQENVPSRMDITGGSDNNGDGGNGDGGGGNDNLGDETAQKFAGLPIESLICGPILAVAKGQQELTQVYLDTVKALTYKDGDEKAAVTNVLGFNIQRPLKDTEGTVSLQESYIQAPLISLVPVPAFLMDEMTVDFTMSVNESSLDESKVTTDTKVDVSYNSWFGLKANISGAVGTESSHRRSTDTTATYKIYARASQQPPSEGMAKLTSLFAIAMEPIEGKYTPSQ